MTQSLPYVNILKKEKLPTLGGNLLVNFNQNFIVHTMGEWLANDMLVFLVIKQSCDAGTPKITTSMVQEATGLSRPTVVNARKRLEKAGALAHTTFQEKTRIHHRTHFFYSINPIFYREEYAQFIDDYLWDISCKVRSLGKKYSHRKKAHQIWPLPDFNKSYAVSFTSYNKTIGIDLFSFNHEKIIAKKRDVLPSIIGVFLNTTKNNNNYYCLQHEGREFLARCCCPDQTTSERDLKRECERLSGIEPVACAENADSSSFLRVISKDRAMKCITEREFKGPLQLLQKKLGITNKGLAYLSIYPSDVIEQALTSALRSKAILSNPYSYVSRACQKIASSMSYTITNENLMKLREAYTIPEEMPFNIPNFKQKQQSEHEKEIDYRPDYDRDYEAAQLIAKLSSMEPAESAIILRNAKHAGLLYLLVDEWPDNLQEIINRV